MPCIRVTDRDGVEHEVTGEEIIVLAVRWYISYRLSLRGPDAIRLLQRLNLPREFGGAEGDHVLVHGKGSVSRMNNRQ